MARKKAKKQTGSNNAVLPVMRPNAAGIDIGATEIFVAVSFRPRTGERALVSHIHAGSVCTGRLADVL